MTQQERKKIAILSDLHLGKTSKWQPDEAGVSKKTNDMINRAYWIFDSIANRGDVSLILIGGDFFDEEDVSDTVVKRIINSVFPRLKKAKIGVIIIGGNHDTTSNLSIKQKLDYLDSDTVSNCIIVRSFSTINFTARQNPVTTYGTEEIKFTKWWKDNILTELATASVGLALFPYLSLKFIGEEYVRPTLVQDGTPYARSIDRTMIEGFLTHRFIPTMINQLSNCENKIALGHYQLSGTRMHHYSAPEDLKRELVFSQEMIHAEHFNTTLFGHIHLPQPVWGIDTPTKLHSVRQIGSTDKVKFDERDDHRCYLLYDYVTKSLEEVSLDTDLDHPDRPQVRPMIQVNVDIVMGDPNPTQTIINKVSEINADTLIATELKIVVDIVAEDRKKISVEEIQKILQPKVFFLEHITLRTKIPEQIATMHVAVEDRMRQSDFHQLLDNFLVGMKDVQQDEGIFTDVKRITHDVLEEAIKKQKESEAITDD